MENKAEEKLRVIDIIKENSAMVLSIGGFIWLIYSCIIIPIKNLEFQVADVIGNHMKTIEDEQIRATTERQAQMVLISDTNGRLIKIETLLGQILNK